MSPCRKLDPVGAPPNHVDRIPYISFIYRPFGSKGSRTDLWYRRLMRISAPCGPENTPKMKNDWHMIAQRKASV